MERLRRQLDSRSTKRASTSRAPRSRTADSSNDLFGRDSYDPYSASAGTWNYGPWGDTSGYHIPPEHVSPDNGDSAWQTTDHSATEPTPPESDERGGAQPYDEQASRSATEDREQLDPDTPSRPPAGRRRVPGQWREEASTAPGHGATPNPAARKINTGPLGISQSTQARTPAAGSALNSDSAEPRPVPPDEPIDQRALPPVSPTATREEKLRAARAALAAATAVGTGEVARSPRPTSENPAVESEPADGDRSRRNKAGSGAVVDSAVNKDNSIGAVIEPVSPTATREEKLRAARAALAAATAAASEPGHDGRTRRGDRAAAKGARRRDRIDEGVVRSGGGLGDLDDSIGAETAAGVDTATGVARRGEGMGRYGERPGGSDLVEGGGDASGEGRADRDGAQSDRRARGRRARRGDSSRDAGPRLSADADRGGAGDEDDEFGRGRRRGRRRRTDAGEGPPESLGPVGGGTEAQAKEVCLRLLADRARSRAELAGKLADRGFNATVAKRALDRLAEVGLINDAEFAQQWVRSRHTYGGRGKKVLAEELRRKGIAPEHAEPALETITSADERDRAADLARRKMQSLPPDMDRDKAMRRLVAMLARRGYDPATAFGVVAAELPRTDRQTTDTAQAVADLATESEPSPSAARHGSGRRTPAAARRESSSDDAESAAELVRAKLRTLSPTVDRDTATRRLVGLLARRGYPSSIAYAVVSAELSDFAATEPPSKGAGPQSEHRTRMPAHRRAAASANPDDVAEEESDPVADERDRAVELVRAKLRGLPRNLDRDKAIRRLVGLLARRGFPQSIAYTVVKEELAGADWGGN